MNQDQDKTKTVVHIFGNEYRLVSQMGRTHLTQIAQFVHQHMKEIADANPRLDSLRVSVLAAVNIADELYRLRESRGEMSSPTRQMTQNLDLQKAYDQLLLDYEELQMRISTLEPFTSHPSSNEHTLDNHEEHHRQESNQALEELKQEHHKLKLEYDKLKNEFSEYTKFVYLSENESS